MGGEGGLEGLAVCALWGGAGGQWLGSHFRGEMVGIFGDGGRMRGLGASWELGWQMGMSLFWGGRMYLGGCVCVCKLLLVSGMMCDFPTDTGCRPPEEPGPSGRSAQSDAVWSKLRNYHLCCCLHGRAEELHLEAHQVRCVFIIAFVVVFFCFCKHSFYCCLCLACQSNSIIIGMIVNMGLKGNWVVLVRPRFFSFMKFPLE